MFLLDTLLYIPFFFKEGNFRLPITKFIGEVLTRYGLHIFQISPVGMPRITHFEFICWAQRLFPSVDMFNVFYYVSFTGGFYSFNYRTTNVLPCSRDHPKSLHDWKHKFFYIRHGVIPIDMHYRLADEGVPKLPVVPYAEEQWYKTLTRNPMMMLQLDEKALVAAGMSMLWAPKNYRHRLSLRIRTKLPWLEHIWDYFYYPTAESLSIHVATPTGAHPFSSVKPEVIQYPAHRSVALWSKIIFIYPNYPLQCVSGGKWSNHEEFVVCLWM
ncbi:hypothetical protein Hanom_Chr12g01110721 [Helianthus anomalus]